MKINQHKKWVFMFLVFLGYLALGIAKAYYLGHFGAGENGNVLAQSENHAPLNMSDAVSNGFTNSRWIINIIISLLYAGLTTLSVYLAFKLKRVTKLVIITYAGMMIMAVLLILIDILIGEKVFGYASARAIKDHLIQTPFVMILFVGAVRVFEGKKLFHYSDSID